MATRSRFVRRSRGPRRAPLGTNIGGPLIRTPAGAPTRAVRLLHRGGLDVGGCLDYRGVRVVGAWPWLAEPGAGIVMETDASEALY